jgi:3-vinyl bacteriochlorophyllide hydratase
MSQWKSAPSDTRANALGGDPSNPHNTPMITHHPGDRLSTFPYSFRRGQFTDPLDPGFLAACPSLSWSWKRTATPLYTAEERRRRDASRWTIVQAVLAPLQFLVFLVSLCLVIRYLAVGEGLAIATASVVVKTITLYAIMITGSIWEREVFGKYLFARPFFWEDVFSILVLALHTLYLVALYFGALSSLDLMQLALAAYTAYVINAAQFVLKLRTARREQPGTVAGAMGLAS